MEMSQEQLGESGGGGGMTVPSKNKFDGSNSSPTTVSQGSTLNPNKQGQARSGMCIIPRKSVKQLTRLWAFPPWGLLPRSLPILFTCF